MCPLVFIFYINTSQLSFFLLKHYNCVRPIVTMSDTNATTTTPNESPLSATEVFANMWNGFKKRMNDGGLPTHSLFTKENIITDYIGSNRELDGTDPANTEEEGDSSYYTTLLEKSIENASKPEGHQREKAFMLLNTLQVMMFGEERAYLDALEPISNNLDRFVDLLDSDSGFQEMNRKGTEFLALQNRAIFTNLEEFALDPFTTRANYLPTPPVLYFLSKKQSAPISRSREIILPLLTIGGMLIGPSFSNIYTESAVNASNRLCAEFKKFRAIDLYNDTKDARSVQCKKNFQTTLSMYDQSKDVLDQFTTDRCRESYMIYLTEALLVKLLRLKIEYEDRILKELAKIEKDEGEFSPEVQEWLLKYSTSTTESGDKKEDFIFGVPVDASTSPSAFFDSSITVNDGDEQKTPVPLSHSSNLRGKVLKLVSDWKSEACGPLQYLLSVPFFKKELDSEETKDMPPIPIMVLERYVNQENTEDFNASLCKIITFGERVDFFRLEEASDMMECIQQWLFCIMALSNDKTILENYKKTIDALVMDGAMGTEEWIAKSNRARVSLEQYVQRNQNLHQSFISWFDIMKQKANGDDTNSWKEKNLPFKLPPDLPLEEYYHFCLKVCEERCLESKEDRSLCTKILTQHSTPPREKSRGLGYLFSFQYLPNQEEIYDLYWKVYKYEINFKDMADYFTLNGLEMLGMPPPVLPTAGKEEQLNYNAICISLYDLIMKEPKAKLLEKHGKTVNQFIPDTDDNSLPPIARDMYFTEDGELISAISVFSPTGNDVPKFHFLKTIKTEYGRAFLDSTLRSNTRKSVEAVYKPPNGVYSRIYDVIQSMWITGLVKNINEEYIPTDFIKKCKNYKAGDVAMFVENMQALQITKPNVDGLSTGQRELESFTLTLDISKLVEGVVNKSDEMLQDEAQESKIVFPFGTYLNFLTALDLRFRRKAHEVNRRHGFFQSKPTYK